MTVARDVALAPRTTLGVGGPAALFIEARSVTEIRQALELANERSLPTVVLGGGSNLLVADRGVRGVAIRQCLTEIKHEAAGSGALLRVAAGTSWDDLVRFTVERGLAGLECLAGIPGDVGAAPMQNIGAYGQEVGPTIRSVELVRRSDGALVTMAADACEFGYRDSVFKRALAERYVVSAVTFALEPGPPSVRYPELSRALEGTPEPDLAQVRAAVLALRRSKSMLLDPSDPDSRSAGSFFVNPTVTEADAEHVAERARRAGVTASLPRFAHEGQVKLSAGWLIEHAGLAKGTRRGAVGLSSKHCLAIVTREGARASEVVRFASEIRARVGDVFGVRLVPEPRPYGFEPGELDALYGPAV
ncbi:MAG: UDP-N-acetylmuramate dehydrogenase [Deltaproteobacteria bacterium]|nr:UDP-N-acetylmuramate dehydrogenase [Deltaproteobacteria bacterium]